MKRRDFLKALVAIPTAVVVGKAAAFVPEPLQTQKHHNTITLMDFESEVDWHWNIKDDAMDALRYTDIHLYDVDGRNILWTMRGVDA